MSKIQFHEINVTKYSLVTMAYNRFDNNCKNIILYVFEARRAFDVVNENILSQDSNVTLDKYEFPLKIIMIFPFQQIETNL